jgi:uncharacterized protein (TIGR00255 family)
MILRGESTMVSSMTGFGRAEVENGAYKFTVEINTVNNRFLEYQMRLPRTLGQLENNIKNVLGAKFNRGKVMVTVNWEQEAAEGAITLDQERADAYFKLYQLLKDRYNLEGSLNVRDFATLPDLIKVEKKDEDIEVIWNVLLKALTQAAEATCAMRQAEGANLARDLMNRIQAIRRITDEIAALSNENVKSYQTRLKTRIEELIDARPVDEERIAAEVAFLADKSDITEECVRLRSHLEQFESSLDEQGPVGKRLNFLLQELNRETNTIGDKSAFYEISRRVITVKEEVERIREQVQNIE